MSQSRLETIVLILSISLIVQGIIPFLGYWYCGSAWTAPYAPSEIKTLFYFGLIIWGFLLLFFYYLNVFLSHRFERSFSSNEDMIQTTDI